MNRTDIEYIIEKLEFYRFRARSQLFQERRINMREILFRGKVLKTNKWVYGSYNLENTLASISGCAVIPKTIGQYTGLKDVHGTRIFEADIVKVYDVYCNETVVGVVEFCDGSFRIYDKDFTSYDRWMYCKVEVIGNVFDSPELLEGDKT